MFIKLCKNGRNRIVDTNNTSLINELTNDGYKLVCDEAGKPKVIDMTKYVNKETVEDKDTAAALAKLSVSTKPPVTNPPEVK